MKHEAKNYDNLLGAAGLSNELLKNHFTLYQGYINNLNKLIIRLNELIKNGEVNTPDFAELKRRFGWEWNGVRLHELYFENMTATTDGNGKEINRNSGLYKKIIENYENYENWEMEFKNIGAMRGIGWVILYYDKNTGNLFNLWVEEHNAGHLSGAFPLLVMDVFEHSYMTDYGIKKNDYIEVFMKLINWSAVEKRLE